MPTHQVFCTSASTAVLCNVHCSAHGWPQLRAYVVWGLFRVDGTNSCNSWEPDKARKGYRLAGTM